MRAKEKPLLAQLAFANLLDRKLLTALAALIIAFGVALVLLLTGITAGTLDEIVHRMTQTSADMIVYPESFNIIFDSVARLPLQYRGKLEEIAGVRYAVPVLLDRAVLSNQGHNIYGIAPEDFELLLPEAELLEGRWLVGGTELMIDSRLSEVAGVRTGDTVKLLGVPFTVAGICRTVMPVRLFAPREALAEVAKQTNNATYFFVKISEGVRPEEVATRIEKDIPKLKTLYLSSQDYRNVLYEKFALLQQTITVINFSAALMSFLVVLLSMFMSILTRTREVGILKALGASRLFIVRELVIEALLVACLGVAAGIGLAYALRPVLMYVKPLTTVVLHPRWLLVAVAMGVGGGVLGALGPAVYASRLDPVETLSYE